MAKSLRSKWRRKMRSERRNKFGKKELERLKTTVEEKPVKSKVKKLKSIYTVKTEEEISKMDGKDYNPKTMRDENGTFPVWMHPRKRRKITRKDKKVKKRQTRIVKRKANGK